MSRVIALSGWKQSGKDTTADYLVSEYGYTRVSFAARLKDMVSETYGVPREDLDSPTRKEMPLHNLPVIPTDPFVRTVHTLLHTELQSGYWTPRALCILEGSMKRSVYSNFWVRSVVQEIAANPDRKYVITDLRYRSEADTLRLLLPDISLMRIFRYVTITTQDPSERDLDTYTNFEHVVRNTGTKEELYATLDTIMLGLVAVK